MPTIEEVLGPLPVRTPEDEERAKRARRAVLPISSGGDGFMLNGAEPPPPLKPHEKAKLTVIPQRAIGFLADRLFIGSAGDDWMLEGLSIDGLPQFEKPIASKDGAKLEDGKSGRSIALPSMPACFKEIVLLVEYVGDNPEGEHFRGVFIGTISPSPAA